MTQKLRSSLALRLAIATVSATVLTAAEAVAQTGDNVLVVVNASSPESAQIAEHYQKTRRVPTTNVVRVTVPVEEEISREAFDRLIDGPVAAAVRERAGYDRILYIVLTKGIPLRVAGTAGRAGTVASVDSELALLYRRMAGKTVAPQGRVDNPYFLGERPLAEARPFTHEQEDIFLVTRLDGYTVADAIGLIDRGSAPASAGRIVLDQRSQLLPNVGNTWLERAADRLKAMGLGERVELDATSDVVMNRDNVLGYYSWGSNDPQLKTRDLKLKFVSGALAATYVSTDARSLREPPASWTIGRWENPKTHFAGSPQSMMGDFIRQGATGVAGHVAEPFLDATIRPDILFPAYLSGMNLAEAFYLAMPYLSWQTVVVGDPLAAPLRRNQLSSTDIDRGTDQSTELPAFFTAHALPQLSGRLGDEAARLMLRAQARLGRNDAAGARGVLEKLPLEPRLADAHMLLATLYETASEWDNAIDRYRKVLSVASTHVAAINNLAYLLAAQRRDRLPEAIALARRAVTLAPRNANVLDTLAWTLHLSGDSRAALQPAQMAMKLAPATGELHYHGAAILAALGDKPAASQALARALTSDPALANNPEVQKLRESLPPPPAPAPGRATAPAPAAGTTKPTPPATGTTKPAAPRGGGSDR